MATPKRLPEDIGEKASVVLPPLEVVPAQRAKGRPPANPVIKNVHHLNDGELKSLAKEASSRAHSSMALWVYLHLDDWKRQLREFTLKGKKDDLDRVKTIMALMKDFVIEPNKAKNEDTGRPPVNIIINGLGASTVKPRMVAIENVPQHLNKIRAIEGPQMVIDSIEGEVTEVAPLHE